MLSSLKRTVVVTQIGGCVLVAVTATALGAEIGPGPGRASVATRGYRVTVQISPNTSRRWNDIALRLRRRGSAVRGAHVSLRFEMPAMSMGAPRFALREETGGVYSYLGPAISMPGTWVLTFGVRPRRGGAFTVVIRDHVGG